MIICLLPKSPSNRVVQAQNAGKGLCLPNLSDKKSLQLPSPRTDLLKQPFPTDTKAPGQLLAEERDLGFPSGRLPRTWNEHLRLRDSRKL